MAQAEADGNAIKKKQQLEGEELDRRAQYRVAIQDAYHQRNLENIIDEAAPLMTEDSEPETIDHDWMANFISKAQLISNAEMQNLWARILAGEANTPGSFSKRTVNFLNDFDKFDAETFQLVCRYACRVNGKPFPYIHNINSEPYTRHDLTSRRIAHLENIGLVETMIPHFSATPTGPNYILEYNKKQVTVPFNNSYGPLPIGHVYFSKTGRELYSLCNSEPVDGLFDQIINFLDKEYALGIIIRNIP